MVKTASLPMVTPCSLAPISAPHIHHGRETTVAWVLATCGIETQVSSAAAVEACSAAGVHSHSWASLTSRSLFLASTKPCSPRSTKVSHTLAA